MKRFSKKQMKVFYKKSFSRAIITILAVMLLILPLLGYWVYSSNMNEKISTINQQNKKDYDSISAMFDNCMRICWYFATYDATNPYLKIDLGVEQYKAVVSKEIDSFMACYNYISSIQLQSTDYTISRGTWYPEAFSLLQNHNGYDIYYAKNSDWPHLIQIQYSPALNFTVTLLINSDECGKAHLSNGSVFAAKDGTVLVSGDPLQIGQNVSQVFGVSLDQQAQKSSNVYASQLPYGSNTYIVTTYDMSNVQQAVTLEILLIVFVACMASVAMIWILSVILKRIYAPIDNTLQILRYYLPQDWEFEERDTQYISRAIHAQKYEVATESVVRKLRQSQLHVLHSQISPHFLCNSLEVIKWKIIKQVGINPQIERSLSIIGSFFENAYEYSKMITTVAEEIVRTENFMFIAKNCFNERLEIIWQVDSQLHDTPIIAMTLQPLIENSVFHGFLETEKTPIIRISIFSQNENIVVEVADNGVGMPQERLDSIKAGLADDEYQQKHIGIKNTHLKYKLLYGESYGITDIKSGPEGTSITLIYPMLE